MEHYTALALNSSRRLFLYFRAGLIRFRALSASSLDFSPTLESLGAGVEGRLFSIPFIGVGLQNEWIKVCKLSVNSRQQDGHRTGGDGGWYGEVAALGGVEGGA